MSIKTRGSLGTVLALWDENDDLVALDFNLNDDTYNAFIHYNFVAYKTYTVMLFFSSNSSEGLTKLLFYPSVLDPIFV